ncbi:MAG: sugar 3,4-ketoisomerase [Chitinophagales bacterium]|jgi:hypothetical protein
MKIFNAPYIIEFPKIGRPELGYISVAETTNLPFIPRRIYWTYFTPEDIIRGHHAHYELEQILIAVSGSIEVEVELNTGEKLNYLLDKPSVGVFLPKLSWHTMKYSHNAVQMCIASMEYKESDYIRDYEVYKQLRND